jgi:peroxiredoxin
MEREDAMTGVVLRRVSAAVMLAVMLIAAIATGSAASGTPAPNVELRTSKGPRVRLADFRGKVVLLEIWASWCPDCKVSFPATDRLHREFRHRGVEVIAVNVDEQRKDAEAFLKAHPHELKVMFDPRAKIPEAFGTIGMPTSYVIDPRGMIRYTHEGYDETTDAAYRREIMALLAEWSESSNRN